jgi:hypothetical protein
MARLAAALVMAVFALGATTTAFACGMNNKTGTQASSAPVVQTGSATTTKTTPTVKPEGGTGG